MNRLTALRLDARVLRSYAPAILFVVSIAAGWTIFIRPLSADQRHAQEQLRSLRQREAALRHEVSQPSPRGIDRDPAAAFARQLATADAAPAVLEQLARLASDARAGNLLIETIEPAQAAGRSPVRSVDSDPRLALFDVHVSPVPIRVAFDTDYASLGQFLWAFRDLPTTVEIRAMSVGLASAESADDEAGRGGDLLRVSLTLHAYSRRAAAVVPAANTVVR